MRREEPGNETKVPVPRRYDIRVGMTDYVDSSAFQKCAPYIAADCCNNCLPLGTDIERLYSSKYLHQLCCQQRWRARSVSKSIQNPWKMGRMMSTFYSGKNNKELAFPLRVERRAVAVTIPLRDRLPPVYSAK